MGHGPWARARAMRARERAFVARVWAHATRGDEGVVATVFYRVVVAPWLVVFVAFDLPQYAGRMEVAWSCDPRGKTGRKISENFRYELEYEAQFSEAPKEEIDVAAIRAEDFLEDEGSFDSGASDTA